MKTSRFFTMALCAMVVAMGATSCKKDNNGNAGDRMTIGANIGQHGGDGAKTVIGDETDDQFPILWSDGDAFTLYSQSSTEGTTFGITSGVGSESGLFEGANPGDAPYFASYPDGVNGVTRTGETTFAYEIPQDQTGLNHAGPMVGYSADGKSVSFDNAMSWVRIGLKGEAKVTKVEMSYSEAKGTPVPLSGTLTITVDGNGGITSTSVAANRKAEAQKLYQACDVTLTADYAYFDFLVPEGAFGDLNKAHGQKAQFKVFGTDGAELATFEKEMPAPAIERNMVYVGEYDTPINEPVATPKFTVGMDGDKPITVEFAPGNLWYGTEDGAKPQEKAFHFEKNQWETTPTSNGNWDESHVSHFLWSPDKGIAVGTNTSVSGSASDVFFTNATQTTANPDFQVFGEEKGTWRTLSNGEWNYLLNSRDKASSLRGSVTLTDVNVSGLVILPDGSTVTASGVTTTDLVATSGAVFLPVAGSRWGTEVTYVGTYGLYWSSTPHKNNGYQAYDIFFGSFVQMYDGGRNNGNAVRLVRDIK